VIHSAEAGSNSTAVDNGDGTYSFIQTSDGVYMVKAEHGSPISIDAGRETARVTFDSATGDFISVEVVSIDGPRPPSADASCDSFVAALT
jgi:hypothetical protein